MIRIWGISGKHGEDKLEIAMILSASGAKG